MSAQGLEGFVILASRICPEVAATARFCASLTTTATGRLFCIDCIREIRSPHSPEMACEEFSKLLKAYGLSRVITDKYGLQWPVEQYKRFGIIAEQSAEPKGSLYVELLPYLNSARVELLDEPRGINQICSLERRTGRGRGEIIDHPPNGFDDVANAIAGAINICAKRGGYDPSWGCGNEEEPEVDIEEARRQRITKVFGSLEAAEAYKQRQRALYGRSVSFPWDTRY